MAVEFFVSKEKNSSGRKLNIKKMATVKKLTYICRIIIASTIFTNN